MFDVKYYEDKNGKSDIRDYIEDLERKAATSKDARVNFRIYQRYLDDLTEKGTKIGAPTVKHINGDIWELRPKNNRIFFFYWKDNKFVLLHYFIKKTKKTPPREIIKAQNKLKDFIERNGE